MISPENSLISLLTSCDYLPSHYITSFLSLDGLGQYYYKCLYNVSMCTCNSIALTHRHIYRVCTVRKELKTYPESLDSGCRFSPWMLTCVKTFCFCQKFLHGSYYHITQPVDKQMDGTDYDYLIYYMFELLSKPKVRLMSPTCTIWMFFSSFWSL